MTRPALRVVRTPDEDARRDAVMYERARLATIYMRRLKRGDRHVALKYITPLVVAYRGHIVALVRVARTQAEEDACDQVMAAMPQLARRFDEHERAGWPDIALGALTAVMTP